MAEWLKHFRSFRQSLNGFCKSQSNLKNLKNHEPFNLQFRVLNPAPSLIGLKSVINSMDYKFYKINSLRFFNSSSHLIKPKPVSKFKIFDTFNLEVVKCDSKYSKPDFNMGMVNGKSNEIECLGNRCACKSNNTPSIHPVIQLPVRTTALSGHPFFSCHYQHRCFKEKPNYTSKRWFSVCKMAACQLNGANILKNNQLNKDLAFSMRERENFGLKGLLPSAVRSQEQQTKAAISYIRSLEKNLTKYNYLRDIQDYNERLFYTLLNDYTEELMPIVYTPIVGEACTKYSHIYKKPRGLFISCYDAGHISSVLNNWPEQSVKAIVVTDGERILGLGDLGANGMGIPVGKLALYTALAGVPPYLTLPVTIDVGTNNETLLNDPFYIGLKQKRLRGKQYDDLIDEFMEAVIKKWGRSCLIQFEDFGNSNAFRLLNKYKPCYCTFNDDIQGTASVAVAGILASHRITEMKTSQHTFLFYGAGEAALGIADLLVMAMEKEGLSHDDARAKIWLVDSKGLVVTERLKTLENHKANYAKNVPAIKELEKIVDFVKPTAMIGVAAQPGAFNESILKKMASLNKHPLIFPLSNPTSKAECTAKEAYQHTNGTCVFASGSPFDSFEFNGKTFHPGQGNNAYIFPGVSLAVMACGVHHIPDETFLVAARALAEQVTDKNIEEGRIYPPLSLIRDVSLKIAAKTAQYFYVESLATVRPEPEDKILFIRGVQYDHTYEGNNLLKYP